LANFFDFAILKVVGTMNEWRRKLRKVAERNPDLGKRVKEIEDVELYKVWIIVKDGRRRLRIFFGVLKGFEVKYLAVTTYLNSNPKPKKELIWEPL
jgi:nanoRNase/pAp phosphatase (c-di-AMP/oligoRNAs hydrolase)